MSQNNTDSPNASYGTQVDGFKSQHENNSAIAPGESIVPPAGGAPRSETQDQYRKKKRLSFGGGNDGRGAPMFKNLETARGKHTPDSYNDQKPPDGFLGAAFKRFVTAKSGSAIADDK